MLEVGVYEVDVSFVYEQPHFAVGGAEFEVWFCGGWFVFHAESVCYEDFSDGVEGGHVGFIVYLGVDDV